MYKKTNDPRRYYAVQGRGKTRRVFAFRSYNERQNCMMLHPGKLAKISWPKMTEDEKNFCYDGMFYGHDGRNALGFYPGRD